LESEEQGRRSQRGSKALPGRRVKDDLGLEGVLRRCRTEPTRSKNTMAEKDRSEEEEG